MSRSQSRGADLALEFDALSRSLLEKLHRKAQSSPRLAEKETPKSPHAPVKGPNDRAKPVSSADPGTSDLLKLVNDYLSNDSNTPSASKIQPGLGLTDGENRDFTVLAVPPAKQIDREGEEVKGDERVAFTVKLHDGSETPITVKDIGDRKIRPQ